MNLKNRGLAFLVFLSSCSPILSDIHVGGDIVITTSHYILNGVVKAGGSILLNTKKISGSGTMDSNHIAINCDEFEFVGTIKCKGRCIIRCANPFDYSQITKEGSGTITIIISPNEFRFFTKEQLSEFAKKTLLEYSTEDINQRIASIRYHAALNSIDEKYIFDSVIKEIDQLVAYHIEHADEKNRQRLKKVLISTMATCAGLGIGYNLYTNRSYIKDKLYDFADSKISGLVIFVLPLSPLLLSLLNSKGAFGTTVQGPQYIEDIDQLNMIKEHVNQALTQPYVLEQGQIIKL